MDTRAKITSKNQITVPSEVRAELNVKPGDRLRFVSTPDGIHVERAQSVTDATAGILKQYAIFPPPSARELREMAEEAWAEEAVERDERTKRGRGG